MRVEGKRKAAWLAPLIGLSVCSSAYPALPASAAVPKPRPHAAVASTNVNGKRAKRMIAAIAAKREACRNNAIEHDLEAVQGCDETAIDAFGALVRRPAGQGAADRLMSDMFAPLAYTQTAGEDAESAQNVVMATYFDLAKRRAEILTGSGGAGTQSSGNAKADLFDWVEQKTARSLARQWEALKKADCASSPVPNCNARLDAAFRSTVTQTAFEGIRSFCSKPGFNPRRVRGPGKLICRGRSGLIVTPTT